MNELAAGSSAISPADILDVRLIAIRYAARETRLYEFASADGTILPSATAGSHIDLHLPNGLVRQYSLVHTGPALPHYVVGIKRDAQGAGGSRYIHEKLQVGDLLKISVPRNNFPLDETALHTVLIAGGIGITPIWAMAQRLIALGRSWEMHYATRARADTAFLDALAALPPVHIHFDAENDGRFLDVASVVANARPDSHLYCCGPLPMLRGFEAAAADRPATHVHVEYFSAKEDAATAGGFTLELARSGKTIFVAAGKTILDVVREAGIDVASSCEQGVCGACETRIIQGIPDHRDAILTESERVENASMMICCSGAKSDRLILDL